jgi:hypothetical protein
VSFGSKVKGLGLLIIGAAGGATLAYFLDPDRGRTRRAQASDQLEAALRDGLEEAERRADYHAGQFKGVVAETVDFGESPAPDDRTLKHRVESEVLGRAGVPKGDIVVHAEGGIVQLRGQVERPEVIDEVVRATRDVEGVRAVESLLHLPGEPEPATAAAREASTDA